MDSQALSRALEATKASVLQASLTMREAATRVLELETALSLLVLQVDNTITDSEGRWPEPDAGCPDCTTGTVPDRLNTGPCAFHNAKRLLGHL